MKCAICLELLYKPQSLDGCGHSFCVFCVERINKKTCPLCRTGYDKTVEGFEFSKLIRDKFPDEWKLKESNELKSKLFKEITTFKFSTKKKKVIVAPIENSNSEVRIINGYEIKPGANLSDADLRGANLSDADLRGANLTGANLCHANLCHADLRCANLRDADLRYADLRYADLRGANLRDADLRYAYLRGANLNFAYLRGADLRDADLTGVNLSDANF